MLSRSIITLALILSIIGFVNAQLELRSNPLQLAVVSADIIIDYELSPEISVELLAGLDNGVTLNLSTIDGSFAKTDAYKFRLLGKYYFKPQVGSDRWFASIILSYQHAKILDFSDFGLFSNTGGFDFIQNSLVGGLGFGYKWVFKNGLVLEASAGYLRSLYVRRTDLAVDTISTDHRLRQFFISTSIGYRFKMKSETEKHKKSRKR